MHYEKTHPGFCNDLTIDLNQNRVWKYNIVFFFVNLGFKVEAPPFTDPPDPRLQVKPF